MSDGEKGALVLGFAIGVVVAMGTCSVTVPHPASLHPSEWCAGYWAEKDRSQAQWSDTTIQRECQPYVTVEWRYTPKPISK